jgi:hypothetical protein
MFKGQTITKGGKTILHGFATPLALLDGIIYFSIELQFVK